MAPQELGEAVSHRGLLQYLFIFYDIPIREKTSVGQKISS